MGFETLLAKHIRSFFLRRNTFCIIIFIFVLSITAQSDDTLQQVQSLGTPETDETSPKTPQSEDADEGGCGCGG